MLDLNQLREQPEQVRQGWVQRGETLSLSEWEALDRRQRDLMGQCDGLRAERNRLSQKIAMLKRECGDTSDLMACVKGVGERIAEIEAQLKQIQAETQAFLYRLPNLSHESVPIGADAKDNVVTRLWGTPRAFSFTPVPHWELGERLGILDFKRAAQIAGARFVISRGTGAALERALMNWMLDMHVREHGYTEILPPLLAHRESLIATGQLPKFEDDLFGVTGSDYFLIPTAEVPLTNLHRNEILDEAQLPLKYVAYTPCFRREAGSYGQDTRGLIRQHQFNKVELVQFSTPEVSYLQLEQVLADAETVLKRLNLPYRVVSLCTGDLGFSAAKTYDLEVWIPSQETYREISSCSNFEAFQARRGAIRYRAKDGKVRHVHTLNGSALAVGRTVVAILENYQTPDGSVVLPEVLRPYMGNREKIEPQSSLP